MFGAVLDRLGSRDAVARPCAAPKVGAFLRNNVNHPFGRMFGAALSLSATGHSKAWQYTAPTVRAFL